MTHYDVLVMGEYTIKVSVGKHTIALKSNQTLRHLVKNGGVKALETLCIQIKECFATQNNRELKISNTSLFVEVLGHLYAYKILGKLATVKLFRPLHIFFKKFSHNAYQINCGEWGYDGNRWFWDFFRITKPILSLFLRK